LAFGRSVDIGDDAEHGVDPAKLGPELARHIRSATNADDTSNSIVSSCVHHNSHCDIVFGMGYAISLQCLTQLSHSPSMG